MMTVLTTTSNYDSVDGDIDNHVDLENNKEVAVDDTAERQQLSISHR